MTTLDEVQARVSFMLARARCELAHLSDDDDLVPAVLEEVSYGIALLVQAAMAPDDPMCPPRFAC